MDTSPKYDFPWELIADSFTGSLTDEGKLQFQQWLTSSPEYMEKYSQLQELWKSGMEDYWIYQMADENVAWKAFRSKLKKNIPEISDHKVIQGKFNQMPHLIRNLIAIAAVVLVFVGAGLWLIIGNNNPVIYESASNAQKKIILKDGSLVTLNPNTRILVSPNYNKSDRTLTMASGEALFDVVHHADMPFTVELGATHVVDVGTNFTVKKGEKEINVLVTSGKVVFVKISSKETRELMAGTSMTFDLQKARFGEIQISKAQTQMLNFENTPLSDAIISIQKVYGKKIIISDNAIANKKITAHLDGMPYHSVLKVICKSLGLEYTLNDSICLLKGKSKEQP